jgi:hypothetical protein
MPLRHIYVDLIFNCVFLVALIVVSGFVDKSLPVIHTRERSHKVCLFGLVAVIGMLQPFNYGPGLIFDGRSFVIALCALFFGSLAVFVAGAMAIVCRIMLSGVGTLTGSLVIVSSALLGLCARYSFKPSVHPLSALNLYYLGLAVHAVMLALMFTLPGNLGSDVVKTYRLADNPLVSAGHTSSWKDSFRPVILRSDTKKCFGKAKSRYRSLFETSLDAILLTSPDGRIILSIPRAVGCLAGCEEEIVAVGRQGLVDIMKTLTWRPL